MLKSEIITFQDLSALGCDLLLDVLSTAREEFFPKGPGNGRTLLSPGTRLALPGVRLGGVWPSCTLPLVSAAPGNAPSPTTGPAPLPPAASAAPPPGTAAAAAARPAAATPAVGVAAAAAAGAGAGPALAAAPAPAAPAWAPAAGVGVEATARQTATPARGAK